MALLLVKILNPKCFAVARQPDTTTARIDVNFGDRPVRIVICDDDRQIQRAVRELNSGFDPMALAQSGHQPRLIVELDKISCDRHFSRKVTRDRSSGKVARNPARTRRMFRASNRLRSMFAQIGQNLEVPRAKVHSPRQSRQNYPRLIPLGHVIVARRLLAFRSKTSTQAGTSAAQDLPHLQERRGKSWLLNYRVIHQSTVCGRAGVLSPSLINADLISVNSCSPSSPISRPIPLCLKPPNGSCGAISR